MKNTLKTSLSKLETNPQPSPSLLNDFLSNIDFDLDKDYIEFINNSNGSEGSLSEDSYVTFWKIEDVLALNPYYDDVEECEKLFFFGSDGANLGYAFDKITGNIVAIDFLEISISSPLILASNFDTFLQNYLNENI
jgi:hypothetical protein